MMAERRYRRRRFSWEWPAWFRRLWTYWTAVGVIPRWQLLLVYGAIITAGIVGFNQTQDALHGAARASHRAERVAWDVQAQRVQAIRTNCEQGNQRHDDILRWLRSVTPDLSEAKRRAGAQAVSPKYADCEQRVRELTRGP